MTAASARSCSPIRRLLPSPVLPSYKQAIQDLFDKPGSAAVGGLPALHISGSHHRRPHNIPVRYEPVMRSAG